MTHCNFYIDGQWVEPQEPGTPHPIINPATEESVGSVSMGGKADADRAVMAARHAFDADHIAAIAQPGDFVITLGCGDVYRIIPQILASLEATELGL